MRELLKVSDLLHAIYIVINMQQMRSWANWKKKAAILCIKSKGTRRAARQFLPFLHVTQKPVNTQHGVKAATEHCNTRPPLLRWHSFHVIVMTQNDRNCVKIAC